MAVEPFCESLSLPLSPMNIRMRVVDKPDGYSRQESPACPRRVPDCMAAVPCKQVQGATDESWGQVKTTYGQVLISTSSNTVSPLEKYDVADSTGVGVEIIVDSSGSSSQTKTAVNSLVKAFSKIIIILVEFLRLMVTILVMVLKENGSNSSGSVLTLGDGVSVDVASAHSNREGRSNSPPHLLFSFIHSRFRDDW